jgi:hypothetical protein
LGDVIGAAWGSSDLEFNPSRLHRFWNPPLEINLQQAVLEVRASHLHIFSETEAPLERSPRNVSTTMRQPELEFKL